MTDRVAYKLVARKEWETAIAAGPYGGSAVDLADGYIHLSGADTLLETARKYYAGQTDLLLLAVDLVSLGSAVVWEPSRGGALFPHIYGSLPASAVTSARSLTVDDAGTLIFGDGAGL
ncbi:MAG: DUF952 domain-containing protein [Alphaproteobacteria bacterium]|nr:MAG: DUF952 domain-containing protein [Alphaproteobacteria bacterium]PZO39943.1 MAG: DUF952 domain-containing protein [Alphaproteobacteria bacterium]